ncbi:AAA family ATPase [Gordonia iterans]
MRLHRLRLKDFRGITEREVCFAEAGITVVEGSNEAGKSSMMDAFDLLLRVRADSKSAEVKAVQPAGRDVGSEVTAEISCGPYRFTYFKRYNRRPETTLTITEPRREQLTGREAHERVVAIQNETLDKALFQALRLSQTEAPDLGALTESAALARALDRVTAPTADENPADGDVEGQALINAAAVEYQRYFTLKSGRPAGELAAAVTTAEAAQADVDARLARLKSAEDAAAELPGIEQAVTEAVDSEVHAAEEYADAGRRLAEAEAVQAGVREAVAHAAERESALRHAERDRDERHAAQRRLAALEQQITGDAEKVADHQRAAARADAEGAGLQEQLAGARCELERIRGDLAAAETAERWRADRARITQINATLAAVRRLQAERTEAAAGLQANPVRAQDASLAAQLDKQIAATQAAIEAVAATVEVTRTGDGEVSVDGAVVGTALTFAAVGESVITAPGVRVVVRGVADAQARAEELTALRARERDLLERCDVKDLDQVSVRAAARDAAERRLHEIDAAVRRALGPATADQLSAERAALQAALPADAAGEPDEDHTERPTIERLRSAERDAVDQVSRAERAVFAKRAEAADLRAREQAQAAAIERARSEARTQRTALLEQRSRISDEALDGAVALAHDGHRRAEAVVVERRREAGKTDLSALGASCAEAEQALDRIRRRLADLRERRAALRDRLEQCREENRLDDLAQARAAAEAAQARAERVRERAAGARMLYQTLIAKRAESRSRYVAPFTRRLEELAAPVFGESVRFEVDDDFTIVSRTLDGVTVDVKQLSGGAREQLGLIARLACAMIVDRSDGVPVILDDALGYSDPERLASMAQVLGGAADDAQIIVLTCMPDRYAAVPDAKVVEV